ncbi:MAG: PSD1 and planctomycete cytochrome C domain-containing protein [Pirellulales bacterium]
MKMFLDLTCYIVIGGGLFSGAIALAAETAPQPVNYNRDIRPILSNHCFKCHGPDAAERKSGLQLDVREAAVLPADSGSAAIVPGKPDVSGLVERVFSSDAGNVMPPPDTNKKLTAAEKELLKRWIEEGAPYQRQWSFVAPRKAELPAVKDATWSRNAIDRFVLATLEGQGLTPSPVADKATLIRRVTLDLTGLPPTVEEVDAFLADTSPDAYQRVVDRLLESPHLGERLALDWLDAARFADTNGYHIDNGRDMTMWRAWVIDAFNRNMPFDQFTIEQLAGDLLPNPTIEQQIASGFNRNHMTNFEGGAIPEEYHTAYIVDRVNTTGTVWLGLSIGCAQCHDHKYDPITQKEFYQFYAFFHNVPEKGLDGYNGNAMPFIKTPSEEQSEQLAQLRAAAEQAEQHLAEPMADIDAAQSAWESESATATPAEWKALDPLEFSSQHGATLTKLDDLSLLASGENPASDIYRVAAGSTLAGITAIQLEALPDEHFTANGPGRSVNGNIVLTHVKASVGDGQPLAFRAASADFSQKDYPVELAIDDKPQSGWAIHPEVGKPHAAVFELAEPLTAEGEKRLAITLEFKSTFGQHQLGRFRLSVTNSAHPHGIKPLPDEIKAALAAAADQRSEPQRLALRKYYRENLVPSLRPRYDELAGLKQAVADFEKMIPTTMVMQELPQPRETFLLIRGQYDKKGDKVTAAVPAELPPLPADAPANRLGLARWLVDPAHPLTARVVVNRYWQMLFGAGLVKTSEDFGSQGDLPTHPELLDWLAVEFQQPSPAPDGSGSSLPWDNKALLRLMVTSATYRQSSAVSPGLLAIDPENSLLARGARQRLPAEFIRDQALAVSGLLNEQIGGPSVSPYQPAGMWEELMSRADGANWTAQKYTQSHGADLYRRTMYTFWKRTSPPPTLVTFDAPDRETCTVRRARTNTPLQALVLLNDPTYVEAARKLAERILVEGGGTFEERITFAYRRLLARPPRAAETAVLQRAFDQQLAEYRANRAAALELLAVGESPRNEELDPAELAAWATLSSILLNLDETVTKG